MTKKIIWKWTYPGLNENQYRVKDGVVEVLCSDNKWNACLHQSDAMEQFGRACAAGIATQCDEIEEPKTIEFPCFDNSGVFSYTFSPDPNGIDTLEYKTNKETNFSKYVPDFSVLYSLYLHLTAKTENQPVTTPNTKLEPGDRVCFKGASNSEFVYNATYTVDCVKGNGVCFTDGKSSSSCFEQLVLNDYRSVPLYIWKRV